MSHVEGFGFAEIKTIEGNPVDEQHVAVPSAMDGGPPGEARKTVVVELLRDGLGEGPGGLR